MKCPNCNGTLFFDVPKGVLKCKHCGSLFEPDEYSRNNFADETEWGDAILYTCRNCGAQLISMDDTAVTYCSYCGSETILSSQMSGDRKPRYLIPFKISKRKCKNIYTKELSKKLYVPDELKQPEFIEKFRAIYIPYWMYYVKFREDPFSLSGSKSYTRGKYDYYEEYEVAARIHDNGLYGIPYDGSRNFDDSIAQEIAPFSRNDMVEYNPAYLAGMYADRANVDAEIYAKEVTDRATEEAINDIRSDFKGINLQFPRTMQQKKEFLQTRYLGHDSVFLPVWFLTWRKDDRVAYAVVNGQTGKIHIDLPVDKNKFFLITLLIASVIFGALSLFVSVTAKFLTWVSALIVFLIGLGFHSEMKKIRDRENHVFDKGYLITDQKDLPMPEKTRERLRNKAEDKMNASLGAANILKIILLSIGGFFILPVIIVFFELFANDSGSGVLIFFVLILQAILFIRELILARHLKDKSSVLTSFVALASVACNFMISVFQPVEDWWYYLGCIICLLAAGTMCLDLIDRFNDLSTRPLPSFYERKGGNDNA